MTRRLYVSDVHLEPQEPNAHCGDKAGNPAGQEKHLQRLHAFSTLLRAAKTAVDEIYVLGDLCEMWIGDDDDSELVNALVDLFSDLSNSVGLHFLAGNRDFLLGEKFAAQTGLVLLSDPHELADGTLLAHGDALCTDDNDYQQLRTLLRSKEWQADILSKSLAERRTFGAGLRAQSRAANANKASNIMDVNAAAVAQLMQNAHSRLLIHGHTHRPGVHPLNQNSHATQETHEDQCADGNGLRLVLGAWERCGWWAVQEDQSVRLRCAPIPWLSARTPESLNAAAAFGI